MATIPGKNDHATNLFISKGSPYDGVKKTHRCSPWIDSSGPCWLHTSTSKNMLATERRYRCDGQVTAELRRPWFVDVRVTSKLLCASSRNVGTDGTFASFPLAKNEKVPSVPSFQAVSQHWPISLMLPTLPLL